MKKTLLTALLAGVLALSAAACGGGAATPGASEPAGGTTPTEAAS